MKKMIFFLLLGSLTLAATAQSGVVGFSYGLYAGTTSTSVKTNIDYKELNNGAGFTGGMFGRIKVLFFQVQPEIAFTTKAASISAIQDGELYNAKLSASNLDINALLNFNILRIGDMTTLRLQGGMGNSIGIESEIIQDGNSYPATNAKSNYLNWMAGAGVDVLKFTADLRYTRSIGDIVTGDDVDMTVGSILLTVGVKFR